MSTSNKGDFMKILILTIFSLLSIMSIPVLSSSAVAATSPGTALKATATVTAKCIVSSTTDIAFGSVDPTTNGNYDGLGTVLTKCSKNTAALIFIKPVTGTTFAMKSLLTGDSITYGLYNDVGRTSPFPSVAGGAKSTTSTTGAPITTTVYGRVVVGAGVNDAVAAATDYTQALIATIEW
jgi:spore coat protein U-like protein